MADRVGPGHPVDRRVADALRHVDGTPVPVAPSRRQLLDALRRRRSRRRRMGAVMAATVVVLGGGAWAAATLPGSGPTTGTQAAARAGGGARVPAASADCAAVFGGSGSGCVGRTVPLEGAAGSTYGEMGPDVQVPGGVGTVTGAPDGSTGGAPLHLRVGRSASVVLPAVAGGAAWGSPKVSSWSGGGGPSVGVRTAGRRNGRKTVTVTALRSGTAELVDVTTCPESGTGAAGAAGAAVGAVAAGCAPVEWFVEVEVVG